VFRTLLVRSGETKPRATEIGVRLGQNSEFTLLIAVLALHTGVIREPVAYLLQTQHHSDDDGIHVPDRVALPDTDRHA